MESAITTTSDLGQRSRTVKVGQIYQTPSREDVEVTTVVNCYHEGPDRN